MTQYRVQRYEYLHRCRPANRRRCGRSRLRRSGPDRGSVSAKVTRNRQGGGGVQNVNALYIKLDWIPLKRKALWSFEASTATHPSTSHTAEDLNLPRHRSDSNRKFPSSLCILMYVVTMSLVETSGGRLTELQAICCYKFDSVSVLVKCDTVM